MNKWLLCLGIGIDRGLGIGVSEVGFLCGGGVVFGVVVWLFCIEWFIVLVRVCSVLLVMVMLVSNSSIIENISCVEGGCFIYFLGECCCDFLGCIVV